MPVRNVLVDWGGQTLLNLGDLAMVQVAVRRLQACFPGARVQVTSHRPEDLVRFCPGAVPISERALQLLFWRRWVPGVLSKHVPGLGAWEEGLFRRRPLFVLRRRAARFLREPGLAAEGEAFLRALRDADLVVAAGGGYLTDTFEGHALRVLGVLEAALALGKPVALLGQGLGPLRRDALRSAVGRVCANACLVTLREGMQGPALLRELGCPDAHVRVTGDEAIESVHPARPVDPTRAELLGFNVRLAAYANLSTPLFAAAAAGVAELAREFGVRVVPIPVDGDPVHGDAASVGSLLGTDPVLDPTPLEPDPAALARRVGRCRVVVTGSYHGAVFALSQGIPAVCLATSAYYQAKFDGLAAQFGPGCAVVRLDGPEFATALRDTVRRQWRDASDLGVQAWEAAGRQLGQSRSAYARLAELVG